MVWAPSAEARRLGWPGAAGLVLSGLLLWWALHDVALRDVAGHLRQARLGPLAGAVLLATATFPLRTLRWRYLLEAHRARLPFGGLWHATAIGFMANNLLPARAGEFARAYVARRLMGVRFSAALGSLAVERVLDGLTLVGLLALGIAWAGLAGDTAVAGVTLGHVASLAAAIFLPALLVAWWLVHWPGLALATARRVLGLALPGRWVDRLVGVLEGLVAGLAALKQPRHLVAAAGWSIALWSCSAASYWLGFAALNLAAPPSAALVLQALVAFGVAIPSSPGFFGPFEAVTRATLALFAVPAASAVSYAVAYHLAVFVPITLLGLWSLSRGQLHLADLARAEPAQGGVE